MYQTVGTQGCGVSLGCHQYPKKTCQLIVESGNDYIGALKGNQPGLLTAVERNFRPEQTEEQINKAHGRIEKRTVSICQTLEGIPDFPGLVTLIRVESERQLLKHTIIEVSKETRYGSFASFIDTAKAFAQRIRGYWGVENQCIM